MMLRKLCGSMPADAVLTGIGIGAPNANYHTGRIERPVNLWKFRPEEREPDERSRFFTLCEDLGEFFPGFPSVSPTTPMPPLSGRSLTAMPVR